MKQRLHKSFTTKLIKIVSTYLGLCLISSAAYAAEQQLTNQVRVFKDQTELNFEDTMIDGQFRIPRGFLLRGNRLGTGETSMVKIRSDFREKILESRFGVTNLVTQSLLDD